MATDSRIVAGQRDRRSKVTIGNCPRQKWSGSTWLALALVLAATVIGVPSATAAPISTAFKTSSGEATAQAAMVAVTLPVQVLPTQTEWSPPSYPAHITVRIARSWRSKIAAYGAAGIVVIAPRHWTAKYASIAADSSAGFLLRPATSTAMRGSLTYYSDGPDVGDSWSDSGEYFPWVRAHWASSGYDFMPVPKVRSGLRIRFIGKRLIAYRIAASKKAKLHINGVAHTSLMPGKQTYPLFDRLEAKLPLKDRGLATAILNRFVARYHRKP